MSEPSSPSEIPSLEDREYEFALQLTFYEGQISWQMNVLFVGLNIGIGTILQNKLQNFYSFDILTIFMSIIGLVINFFWLGTFLRNNKYYEFRMAQARHAEPEKYKLVNRRGYRFSKGKKVFIPYSFGEKNVDYKLSRFEEACSNKRAIGI
nr:hypothetical protein [Mucilaginibacter sp. L294]